MKNKTPREIENEKLLQQRQERQRLRNRRIRQQQRQRNAANSSNLVISAPKKKVAPKKKHRTNPPIDIPTQDPAAANHTAYIIAGGPSLKGFNWSLLDDKFTVGINRAYEAVPSANIIYFTDEDYYERHIEAMKEHGGRLIKGCINVGKKYDPKVERFKLKGPTGLEMTPGVLSHGRNSTYAAINMLAQWKFTTIYLMGVDMKWGKKGKKNTSHWHSGHKRIDGEGAYAGFIKNFEKLPPLLKPLDVEVININNDTNLKAFPIQTYEEHFGSNCFL